MKIFILVKRNILTIIFGIFMVLLIVFSKNNLSAAKDGLVLWANCVVPALFPFFIATELLNYTNIASIFGRFLNKFMKPIFNIPGEGAYAFLMGIISGYPVGAKIVSDFYSKNICTKEEAERMLAFTNNSGPLFIIGTVGIALFGNSTIGILLFVTHILSSISVGIILGIFSRLFHTYKLKSFNYRSIDDEADYSISSLGNILSNSIQKAISTIFLIGGFVVLFSIILSIDSKLSDNSFSIFTIAILTFAFALSLIIPLWKHLLLVFELYCITRFKSFSANISMLFTKFKLLASKLYTSFTLAFLPSVTIFKLLFEFCTFSPVP